MRASGDDIGSVVGAGQHADELSRLARASARTRNADMRFHSVAADLTADLDDNREAVRKAVYSVAWDAFCDVTAGDVPREPDKVRTWLVQKAVSLGLEFLGESAARLAGEIVAASEGLTNAPSTCQRLPKSGL